MFRQRAFKACAACRARKTRCDGQLPCNSCRERNIPCSYRTINRIRKRKSVEERLRSQGDSGSTASPGLNTDADPSLRSISETLQSEVVHPIISAAQTGLPLEVSQLYYGACSHFSALQQIHRALTTETDQPGVSVEDGDDWQEGLDIYGHCELFFGSSRRSDPSRPPYLDSKLAFLPCELAQHFLRCYLRGVHQLFPFWSTEDLESMLDCLYGKDPKAELHQTNRLIILISLAIGATSTEHSHWAEALYERSKSESDLRSDIVNISTHSYYQIVSGRPNLSYLQLGAASRVAFAAGMHRDIDHPSKYLCHSSAVERAEERRTTFWGLAFFECWTSYAMGRPNAINLTDSSCPFPEHRPFISILAHLSQIMLKSKNQIYGQHKISLLALWKSAQRIHTDLQRFVARVKTALGFDINSTNCAPNIDIKHLYLTNFYNHTVILTFKPFLIVHKSWQKTLSTKWGDNPQLPIPSNSWLSLACDVAVKAASRLVDFMSDANQINPEVKTQRFFAWHIVNARFLLFDDTLRNRERTYANLRVIDRATAFLSALPHADVVTRIMLAISRLREKMENRRNIPQAADANCESLSSSGSILHGDTIPIHGEGQLPRYNTPLSGPQLSAPANILSSVQAPVLQPGMVEQPELQSGYNMTPEGNEFHFNFDVLAADLENLFDYANMDLTGVEEIVEPDREWGLYEWGF